MCAQTSFRLDPDHPSKAGHFPGNPIIPGAVLLDEIFTVIGERIAVIKTVKFLQPVRPGDNVTIDWQILDNEIRFTCAQSSSGAPVATGMAIIGEKS